MNRNKALLDSLMGMGRDISRKDKAKGEPEWKKEETCKNFLIGYCPGKALGKEIENARALDPRAEFDPKSIIQPCRLLHSVGLKNEFELHKDYEKHKRQYQDKLATFLDKALREVEDKVAREKRRHDEGIAVMTDQDRLCEVCGLKYKLRLADINIRDTDGGKYKPDIHHETALYKGYVKLRQKLYEIEEEIRNRKPLPEEEKEKNGKGSRDRGGSRSRGGSRRDSRGGSRGGSRRDSRDRQPVRRREDDYRQSPRRDDRRSPRRDDRVSPRRDDRRSRRQDDDRQTRRRSPDYDDRGPRRDEARSRSRRRR